MYIITVLFSIQPTHQAAFLQAITSNAKTSLAEEDGCRQFDVCISVNNPCDVFLYEVYDSKEAFEAHIASDYFVTFNALTSAWAIKKLVSAFERVHH